MANQIGSTLIESRQSMVSKKSKPCVRAVVIFGLSFGIASVLGCAESAPSLATGGSESGANSSDLEHSPAITLRVFGPQLPFMFSTSRVKVDFAWSELIASGDTGLGTVTKGAGEVIGVDGDFYVADLTDPTPRNISNENTPSGVVTTFTAQATSTIPTPHRSRWFTDRVG